MTLLNPAPVCGLWLLVNRLSPRVWSCDSLVFPGFLCSLPFSVLFFFNIIPSISLFLTPFKWPNNLAEILWNKGNRTAMKGRTSSTQTMYPALVFSFNLLNNVLKHILSSKLGATVWLFYALFAAMRRHSSNGSVKRWRWGREEWREGPIKMILRIQDVFDEL